MGIGAVRWYRGGDAGVMMNWFPWTIVKKSELRRIKLENATYRDDLKNYTMEIRKYKILLSQLRSGSAEVFSALEKMSMKT